MLIREGFDGLRVWDKPSPDGFSGLEGLSGFFRSLDQTN